MFVALKKCACIMAQGTPQSAFYPLVTPGPKESYARHDKNTLDKTDQGDEKMNGIDQITTRVKAIQFQSNT